MWSALPLLLSWFLISQISFLGLLLYSKVSHTHTPHSCKIFSLSVILCSLHMMCLGVGFTAFVFLSVPELPGSEVWCLTLIWGEIPIVPSNIASFSFSQFPSHIPVIHTFCNCPTVGCWDLSISALDACSFYLVFFFPLLLFGSLCWHVLNVRDSVFSCVQSTKKPIKASFIIVFVILGISFLLFLRISIMLFTGLVCCLLYPLESLAC